METLLCGYTYPGVAKYDLVVIHTNEGNEGPKSAEALAAYLHTKTKPTDPGYHRVVDEDSVVQTCYVERRVNGAGGVNSRAFHICITGYAAQSSSQWGDESSQKAIHLAANEARLACLTLNVPPLRISDPRNQRGICGHADVSRYYPASQGHTDPGPYFPWAQFMGLVISTPTPTPILEDNKMQVTYTHEGVVYLWDGSGAQKLGPFTVTQLKASVEKVNATGGHVSIPDMGEMPKQMWDELTSTGAIHGG